MRNWRGLFSLPLKNKYICCDILPLHSLTSLPKTGRDVFGEVSGPISRELLRSKPSAGHRSEVHHRCAVELTVKVTVKTTILPWETKTSFDTSVQFKARRLFFVLLFRYGIILIGATTSKKIASKTYLNPMTLVADDGSACIFAPRIENNNNNNAVC